MAVADISQYKQLLYAGVGMSTFTAWGIGANDVATNFGTSVGAGCITISQAFMLAGVFEFAGSITLGQYVSDTISKKIVSPDTFEGVEQRVVLMIGFISALFGSGLWLALASRFSMPVSTTHATVGGVLGFGVVAKGFNAVQWDYMTQIAGSWVLSPLLSLIIAFLVQKVIHFLVYSHSDPYARAKMVLPYFWASTITSAAVFVVSQSKGLGLSIWFQLGLYASTGMTTLGFAHISMPPSRGYRKTEDVEMEAADRRSRSTHSHSHGREKKKTEDDVDRDWNKHHSHGREHKKTEDNVEMEAVDRRSASPASLDDKIYAKLPTSPNYRSDISDFEDHGTKMTDALFKSITVVMACSKSFAHGANDVSNAVGPLVGVLSAFDPFQRATPEWVLVLCATCIVIGLSTYGWKVMLTVGEKVTKLTPNNAFVVELSAVISVLVATVFQMPVSSTHATMGALVGLSLASDGKTINWSTIVDVGYCMILTVPVVGFISAGSFSIATVAILGPRW